MEGAQGRADRRLLGRCRFLRCLLEVKRRSKQEMAVLSLSSTSISKEQGRKLHPLADFFPPLLPSAARPNTMDPHSKANESPQPQPCEASGMQRRNKKFPRMLSWSLTIQPLLRISGSLRRTKVWGSVFWDIRPYLEAWKYNC